MAPRSPARAAPSNFGLFGNRALNGQRDWQPPVERAPQRQAERIVEIMRHLDERAEAAGQMLRPHAAMLLARLAEAAG
jgi:hypothetical protein